MRSCYIVGVRRLALFAVLGLWLACSREEPRPAPQQGSQPGSRPTPLTVVTLMPSATEVMAALGATNLLVGVDDYSTYPPEVQRLPKVGAFLSPNLEAIVRLRRRS